MLKSHKSCRIFDCSSFLFISRKLKDFLLTAKGASNKILRKKNLYKFHIKKERKLWKRKNGHKSKIMNMVSILDCFIRFVLYCLVFDYFKNISHFYNCYQNFNENWKMALLLIVLWEIYGIMKLLRRSIFELRSFMIFL